MRSVFETGNTEQNYLKAFLDSLALSTDFSWVKIMHTFASATPILDLVQEENGLVSELAVRKGILIFLWPYVLASILL